MVTTLRVDVFQVKTRSINTYYSKDGGICRLWQYLVVVTDINMGLWRLHGIIIVTRLSIEATVSAVTMATTYRTRWWRNQEHRVKHIFIVVCFSSVVGNNVISLFSYTLASRIITGEDFWLVFRLKFCPHDSFTVSDFVTFHSPINAPEIPTNRLQTFFPLIDLTFSHFTLGFVGRVAQSV